MAGGSQALRDVPGVRQSRDALGLRNDFVAPTTDRERAVARIWCEVFNLDRVGVDDNFFDLGGDSMIATTIAVAVSDELGIDFKPSLVSERDTVRRIAAIGAEAGSVALPSNLVSCRAGGSRPPIFFIHGQLGISFLRPGFLGGFHDNQPVYAFQVPGYDGREKPLGSIEAIAENYLNGMLSVRPRGPWFIAAFCMGSWIASEMIKQMAAKGLKPDRVVLLDPLLVRRPASSRLLEKIKVATYFPYKQRRRLSIRLRSRLDGGWTGQDNSAEETLTRVYRSGAAAKASAMLQMAYRRYRPGVLDFPVDLVLCKLQADSAKNPIKGLFPRHSLIVSGESHIDAVSSDKPTNARIIQTLVDQSLGPPSSA
jgi:acyl carrier protein